MIPTSNQQNQIHRRRRHPLTDHDGPHSFVNLNDQNSAGPANFNSVRRREKTFDQSTANNFGGFDHFQPVVSLLQTSSGAESSSCFENNSNHSSWSDFSSVTTDNNDSMSSVGDRTQEFRTIGKSCLIKLQLNSDLDKSQPRVNQILAETARFNQYAKKIGSDLSCTFAKLEKLAHLVKKRSPFDQSSAFDGLNTSETDELTRIIKMDIDGLNRQIAQLQKMMVQRQELKSASHKNQTTSHSKSVVLGLQSKLVSMSNEFKSVLEVRTENLRRQKSRREKLGGGATSHVPANLPPSASQGRLGSVLLADEYQSNAKSDNFVLDMPNQQGQQLMIRNEQDAYLRSRADAMQNIESTIVDLGQIFSQLAHMVQEQGEMVQRIDAHVDEANLNVEAAHMQLLQYMRNISNNRWLALKVFGVLIVFFIIFIIFLA